MRFGELVAICRIGREESYRDEGGYCNADCSIWSIAASSLLLLEDGGDRCEVVALEHGGFRSRVAVVVLR